MIDDSQLMMGNEWLFTFLLIMNMMMIIINNNGKEKIFHY